MSFTALRVMDKGQAATFQNMQFDAPQAGEIRVRVAYSCLNYKDALAVTGSSPIMRDLPCTAGIDLAGTVELSEDPRYNAGDRILICGANIGEVHNGGLAEYAQLPADFAVKLPDFISFSEAMTYGTAGFTAALALHKLQMNQQDPDHGPIAVSGATGGVGSIAIGLLSNAGYSVTALSAKSDQADYLKCLGAQDIWHTDQCGPIKGALMKPIWGGAIDNLGGDMLAWLIATCKGHGNVASIGLASSFKLQTTVMPFILRGVNLLGIHSVDIPHQWREDTWHKLFNDWRLERPDRLIKDTIKLSDVPEACAQLIAGQVSGRYLVNIGE